jgi:predicted  nucleic acid-binding Zn-ribbon protein
VTGLFRRRAARRNVEPADAYDAEPAEAAYRRLLELAQQLRASSAGLAAAAARIEMRAARANTDAVEEERQQVAEQRAALDAAVARIEGEARDVRRRLDAAATAQAVSGARARLQETAAALHGHRTTLAEVVEVAEDEALRLEARARGLAELYGQTSGEGPPTP